MNNDKLIRSALNFYASLPKIDDGYEVWYSDEGKVAEDALKYINSSKKAGNVK